MDIVSERWTIEDLKENDVLFISDVRKDIGDGNLAYIYNYLPEKFIVKTNG